MLASVVAGEAPDRLAERDGRILCARSTRDEAGEGRGDERAPAEAVTHDVSPLLKACRGPSRSFARSCGAPGRRAT